MCLIQHLMGSVQSQRLKCFTNTQCLYEFCSQSQLAFVLMHKPFTPSPESFLSVLDLYRTQTIPAQPTIQRTAAFPFLHKVSSTSLSSKGTFLAFDDLYIVYIKSSAFDSQMVWVGGKACLWKSEWGVWKFWKDYENEKWKEEEEKSVSRSSIYRLCILLGTTIFGINISFAWCKQFALQFALMLQ